jgi:hypothetical protein
MRLARISANAPGTSVKGGSNVRAVSGMATLPFSPMTGGKGKGGDPGYDGHNYISVWKGYPSAHVTLFRQLRYSVCGGHETYAAF